MELHQLRYVVAVAKTNSFSRAAERCHVAQPSLSQQISKLEDELGGRLFHRLKRGIKLTPAGEAFIERAHRILDEVETARRAAREVHDLVRGSLTVGALPTIAPYFLPPAVAAFNTRYPGVDVIVQEEPTARLLRLLESLEVDLAILSPPIPLKGLEREILFTEELLLALPHRHPLTKKTAIRVADLDTERFILMKEGHCLGDQVLAFCNRNDFRPNISCRSAQVETMQALVMAGLGISLVPHMARHCGPRRQPVYRSLEPPKPMRTIVAVWPRGRPPGKAAGEMLACFRQAAAAAANGR